MEEFEKELERLRYTAPPRWLKARAMVAAANRHEGLQRRKRRVTVLAMVAAAVISLFVIAHYILAAFGIVGTKSETPFQAGPMTSPVPTPHEAPAGH